jgi:hypothetical protein
MWIMDKNKHRYHHWKTGKNKAVTPRLNVVTPRGLSTPFLPSSSQRRVVVTGEPVPARPTRFPPGGLAPARRFRFPSRRLARSPPPPHPPAHPPRGPDHPKPGVKLPRKKRKPFYFTLFSSQKEREIIFRGPPAPEPTASPAASRRPREPPTPAPAGADGEGGAVPGERGLWEPRRTGEGEEASRSCLRGESQSARRGASAISAGQVARGRRRGGCASGCRHPPGVEWLPDLEVEGSFSKRGEAGGADRRLGFAGRRDGGELGGGRSGRGWGLLRRRGHLAGDHRLGAPEERIVVARQDPGPRGAPAVADHVTEVRHAGQAPRTGGRKRVSFPLPCSMP